MLINIAVVALIQMVVMEQTHTQSSYERLETVKETIAQNEENIAQLTAALGENNLAKSRAFADLLATDATILQDEKRLNEVKDRLMVSELHVIDEQGIITHTTIKEYIGFDMNSGEQSAAFMPIAKDPSLEIVQEPTANAAEGAVMQYIGVARKDAPGLVQVGIHPEVLETMLKGTQIDVVFKGIEFGTNGYVYALDAETGDILAFPDNNLIGTSAQEAGIPQEAGKGSAKFNGTRGKYVSQEIGRAHV